MIQIGLRIEFINYIIGSDDDVTKLIKLTRSNKSQAILAKLLY